MIALVLLTAFGQNTIPTPAADSYAAVSVELIPGVKPGPAPAPAVVEERARALGRSLRCPVCQGSNITDSPSPTAKAMFERTRQLIAAGYDDDQIVEYFVDKYTENILLDPKLSAGNALLYIGPGLALGLALALVAFGVSRRREDDTLGGDASSAPHTLDDYERRLLAELNGDD